VIERTVEAFGGIDVLDQQRRRRRLAALRRHASSTSSGRSCSWWRRRSRLTRLALPSMLERPGASVVNMTSVGWYRQTRGNLAHTRRRPPAQLTRLMAADLGPKIRVSAAVAGAVGCTGLREVFERRARHAPDDHRQHPAPPDGNPRTSHARRSTSRHRRRRGHGEILELAAARSTRWCRQPDL
jgi:NAD(P)-dependent dehydrogenase (short-subunit alcohol dehydrogenase family)